MNWREELRQNVRLRLGLALIAAILGFYGLLLWSDHQAALAGQRELALVELDRLKGREAMAQWPARARQAKAAAEQAESRLWRQTSLGLAQAELQDYLREQLRAASAQNAVVKLAESEDGLNPGARPDAADAQATSRGAQPYRRFQAQVEFSNTDPKILIALLGTFASHQRLLAVENLSIKPQRVDLRVTAWFLPVAGQTAAAAAAINPPR